MLDPSALSDDPVANLQLGLAVELSVLPPYLYALWSIKPVDEGASTAATEAANSIRGVVYEEMLHAALVGNILRALGKTPEVTKRLMRYPGTLPGHITSGPWAYTVSLGPLSPSTITTFMKIEGPDWFKPEDADDGWKTIADLYDKVATELKNTKPNFGGGHQLPPGDNPGPGRMIDVIDLKSALDAIETIVDQGEGHRPKSANDPQAEYDDDHEVAHFYQFETIAAYFKAKPKLIDPSRDLYPVIENPNAAKYTPAQQQANAAFNKIYTALLDSIQAMFTADAPRAFGEPTELMAKLGHAAALLRNLGPVPGTSSVAGPTFEYLGSAPEGAA